MTDNKKTKFSILSVFLVLLTVFLSLILATSITIISYTYYETSRAFLNSAGQQIDTISQEAIANTIDDLESSMKIAQGLTWGLNGSEESPDKGSDKNPEKNIVHDKKFITYTLGILSYQKSIEAFFIGDERGNVLNINRILDKQQYVTETIPVPKDTAFMVRRIDRSQKTPTESREYLTKTGTIVGHEEIPLNLIRYDARVRPWYTLAKESKGPRWTDVYLFENNEIGITAAMPALDKKGMTYAVIGVDMRMQQVSEMLGRIKIGANGIPFIITETGEVVGHPDNTKTFKKKGEYVSIANIYDTGQPQLGEAFSQLKKRQKPNFTFEFVNESYIASFLNYYRLKPVGWITLAKRIKRFKALHRKISNVTDLS